MHPNQTLQQTADRLGIELQTLMRLLLMLQTIIDEAETTKTERAIAGLPRLIEG